MEQYQPIDGDPFAASAVSLQPVFGDPFTAGAVTPDSQEQAQTFMGKASQTWPARLAQTAYTAAMAPGDYMQGKISDEEAQQQAFNLAGFAITGGVISGVERGAGEAVLGSGPIRQAAEKAPTLEPVTGDPFTPITAYHGSPHDFAPTPNNPLGEFDSSKIGTGEGAQAYGYGHYLAGNERVAADYRNKLSLDTKLPTSANHENGYYRVDESGNPLKNPDGSVTYYDNQADASYNEGKMYQVQINADPNHFLDWDKPLSEQHPVVQQKLQPLLDQLQTRPSVQETNKTDIFHNGKWVGYDPGGLLGGGVGDMRVPQIESIARSALGDDGLAQLGIPGIKYLDAGSRTTPFELTTEGVYQQAKAAGMSEEDARAYGEKIGIAPRHTSNYVVFDDKTIQILKKYGIGGLGIGTAAGLSHFKTQPVNGDPYAGDNGG